jgi:mono/diheme cytochrome c family protein
MKAVLKALLVLVAMMAVAAAALFYWIGSRGISAKVEPGPVETAVARTLRQLAIPRASRNRPNPVALTPEILAEGMAHYADHCAACHANDGSGETALGLGLYPKAPDMRGEPTQSLTDGELFYIIENGVRLTGMPAWSTGTPEGEEQSWHLVHFIRQLPQLTVAQLEQMQERNPRSPAEIRQEIEAERFLRGEDSAPRAKPQPPSEAGEHVHE